MTTTITPDQVRQELSKQLRSKALMQALAIGGAGFGAGFGLRSLVGLGSEVKRNLNPPKAQAPGSDFIPMPSRDEDEKRASLQESAPAIASIPGIDYMKNLIAGNKATTVGGIPWFPPLAVAAGAIGPYAGAHAADWIADKMRNSELDAELEEEKKKFHSALNGNRGTKLGKAMAEFKEAAAKEAGLSALGGLLGLMQAPEGHAMEGLGRGAASGLGADAGAGLGGAAAYLAAAPLAARGKLNAYLAALAAGAGAGGYGGYKAMQGLIGKPTYHGMAKPEQSSKLLDALGTAAGTTAKGVGIGVGTAAAAYGGMGAGLLGGAGAGRSVRQLVDMVRKVPIGEYSDVGRRFESIPGMTGAVAGLGLGGYGGYKGTSSLLGGEKKASFNDTIGNLLGMYGIYAGATAIPAAMATYSATRSASPSATMPEAVRRRRYMLNANNPTPILVDGPEEEQNDEPTEQTRR